MQDIMYSAGKDSKASNPIAGKMADDFKPADLQKLLLEAPEDSFMVVDSLTKAHSVYSKDYKKILVSVSGGSDSDVVVDICCKMDPKSLRTTYVWYDTGLEYQATKQHLDYLEKRYGIKIERIRPEKPVPLAVREYGQPFLSKVVSIYIHRLQLHDFKWEDEPFEILYKRYPHCKSALQWWCDEFGEGSSFSIKRNKYLKEFMMANPPTFRISGGCCEAAKKKPAKKLIRERGFDLNVIGVRKAEGGARGALNACFVPHKDGKKDKYDVYRPVFWYTKADKKAYENAYGIQHSRCYSDYLLKRTGCANCPFGSDFENELAICDRNEPMLSQAARNIFKDSYEYTRKYREFVARMEEGASVQQNDNIADDNIVELRKMFGLSA